MFQNDASASRCRVAGTHGYGPSVRYARSDARQNEPVYDEHAFRWYGHGKLGSKGDRGPFVWHSVAVFLQIERFNKMSINRIGFALSSVLVVSYALCLVFDQLLPQFSMHELWAPLLPGFSLTPIGIVVGFIELISYGWYIAVLYVLAHRYSPVG